MPLQQRETIDCAEMGRSMLRPYMGRTPDRVRSQEWMCYLGFLLGFGDAFFENA